MNALTRNERALLDTATRVNFTLNGQAVTAQNGETLLQAAQREGVEIPHLCYKDGLEPAGNCRACVVEVAGERVLAPSCCRHPVEGMVINTNSERAERAQRLVLELLQSDMPEAAHTRHNELDHWSAKLNVGKPRFAPRPAVAPDLSHPAIAVNLDACIQCTRCLRACRDEQVNDVIGLAFRGSEAAIVFDMQDPMGASTCGAASTSICSSGCSCASAASASVQRAASSSGAMASVSRASSPWLRNVVPTPPSGSSSAWR